MKEPWNLVFYISYFVSGFILFFFVSVGKFRQSQVYIVKVLFITIMIFRKAFQIVLQKTNL